MGSAEKAIGLFGGTFDPVHSGHVAIANSYLNSGFIDELWVILTPDPPHKSGQGVSAYPLRKKMLEEAFRGLNRVKISDLEMELPKPSYTIQTILHLKQTYSSCTFYLCIGGDSLVNFKTWYRWQDILKHCDLLVADRPNSYVDHVDDSIIRQTHFVEHSPVDISSSVLRKKISRGEEVGDQIPEKAYTIIKEHNLYRE